jgi:hypothetical protein
MTDFEEQIRQNLENDWGPWAKSDYRIGDILRYRLLDSSTASGVIVWVTGPSESRVEGRDPLPMRYIVEREGWHDSFPDVVYSKDILTS